MIYDWQLFIDLSVTEYLAKSKNCLYISGTALNICLGILIIHNQLVNEYIHDTKQEGKRSWEQIPAL